MATQPIYSGTSFVYRVDYANNNYSLRNPNGLKVSSGNFLEILLGLSEELEAPELKTAPVTIEHKLSVQPEGRLLDYMASLHTRLALNNRFINALSRLTS